MDGKTIAPLTDYGDRASNIWFDRASAGGDVHRFDGETFRYFSVEDGLGTGGVPSIREDKKGNLWFGTTSGVYRFGGERIFNFHRSAKSEPLPPTVR